ncbi:MAG TPA: hypothetical protein VFA33_16965 [Bryobacteraceae bacterium]|nr:hypothetical protein [Bryobacteraceae bacterium]
MKRFLFWLSCLALPLSAAELASLHSVYLLPMANGMDQYLANRLTNLHVLQVVTDPQRAEAVLTDRIGQPLEDRLQDLYPPPPDKEAKQKQKEKQAEKEQDSQGPSPIFGDVANKLATPGTNSSFGRAKGTIFLVEVKTRKILWSTYQRPKDTTSHQLDRTATQIVNQLKLDMAGTQTQP